MDTNYDIPHKTVKLPPLQKTEQGWSDYTPPADAVRFIELLTGSADSTMHFRTFHEVEGSEPSGPQASNYYRKMDVHAHFELRTRQEYGHGVFLCVNAPNQLDDLGRALNDADITSIRAFFVDSDGAKMPEQWHLKPTFICWRSDTNWHAYWVIDGADPKMFKPAQLGLAAYYGTDTQVCNPSRVMRVPGYLHLKGVASEYHLLEDGCPKYTAEQVLNGIEIPEEHKQSKEQRAVPLAEVRDALSWIDPTFKGQHNSWIGICKCIMDMPLVEDVDRWPTVVDWCSGALWNARTGDTGAPETYEGDLRRTIKESKGRGEQTTYGTIYKLAKDAGWAPPKTTKRRKLTFLSYDECDSVEPPLHLVEDLLELLCLIILYGPPNVGKSFLALDICFHIAAGKKWRGKDVEQGYVCYIAGESPHGIALRVKALKQVHKTKSVPLDIITSSVNLLEKDADVSAIIESVRERAAGMPIRMVVADTLSSVFGGGDENGPSDMGDFIDNLRRLRDELVTSVMVVHHSGKDVARGARGNSKLKCDGDTEIEVFEQAEAKLTCMTVAKNRNIETTDEEWAWKRDVTELGLNSKGKKITTCVLRPFENAPKRATKMGRNNQLLLEILTENCKAARKHPHELSGIEQARHKVKKQYTERYSGGGTASRAFNDAWKAVAEMPEHVMVPREGFMILGGEPF